MRCPAHTTRLYALEKLKSSGELQQMQDVMPNIIVLCSRMLTPKASHDRKLSGWPFTVGISTMCAPVSIGRFLPTVTRRSEWR